MSCMKSLIATIKQVRDCLNNIEGAKFYHYRRPEKVKNRYGIWAEDGEDMSFNAGNRKAEQQIHGTIDYFTTVEYDSVVDEVQEALFNLEGASWKLTDVQYEDETNLIHFTWEFYIG